MNKAWNCLPNGTINGLHQCHPVMDWSQPGYAEWFREYPISLFGTREEAAELFDGLMVDGAGYFPNVPWMVGGGNISITR